MILSVNTRVHLIIDGLYDGPAAMADDGATLCFPCARKRKGIVAAEIDGKACNLRLDSLNKRDHPFLYASPVD